MLWPKNNEITYKNRNYSIDCRALSSGLNSDNAKWVKICNFTPLFMSMLFLFEKSILFCVKF